MEKIKKSNRILGLIKRSFSNLDFESFLLLYKSLIRSHLEYAQTVWSPYKKKYIDAIERVQRRATKILPCLKLLSYEERLRKLNLPSLVYKRSRGDSWEHGRKSWGGDGGGHVPPPKLWKNIHFPIEKKSFSLISYTPSPPKLSH